MQRPCASRLSADIRSRMSVVYHRIEELKPDPTNPRLHSKKQIRQIADSIKAFGFNVPLLIDRELKVIAGHGRLSACRELGWSEVPTLCLDHLTPAQARAFRIADNKLTEIAVWDDRLLAQQLKDLSLLGLDFNIEVTGFEMAEIDLRIASLDDLPDRADDPADVVPEVPAGPPLSKLGDVWLLGCHRVLCGDARDAAACVALMGEERAAMGFTTHPIMCRSMAMRAASAPSTIARSRWPRARWTAPSSPPFSPRPSATSPHSALTARCTTSAWIGAMPRSCWPPAEVSMAS
jgi:ParB-like chromosome segregation protein Spo0J